MTKNKKILIVTECFYPEEFKINDIAFAWKSKGYEVDVLTLVPTYPLGKVYKGYKNLLFQKEKYKDLNIIRLKAVTGYLHSSFKKKLKYISFMILGSITGILIGRKYDYIFGFNMAALTDMLPAVLIHKLYKKPTMFWVQDIWPDNVYAYGFKKNAAFSYLLDFFVKFMFHNISSVAISSKGFESKLKPYTKKNISFHYAPNWADDLNLNIEPITLSKTRKVQFNFSGNIGKVQNLENIIKAYCMLSFEFKNKSQLNIIGDGSNLNCLKSLSKNNSNIIFHGQQKRENMAMYYKSSDFLIISLIDKPIFSKTVPAKTQTYISARKPILAIINGEVADIVRENNLGICVNPSDIDQIKKAFEKCIKMSDDEKSNYVINNSKLIKTTFNKEKIINNLTKILTNENI